MRLSAMDLRGASWLGAEAEGLSHARREPREEHADDSWYDTLLVWGGARYHCITILIAWCYSARTTAHFFSLH